MNLNVTPEFEQDLRLYMKRKRISKKSDALRLALREAVTRLGKGSGTDFRTWLGAALKAPLNRKPKFGSEDELWS
jgi:hypothetical protein